MRCSPWPICFVADRTVNRQPGDCSIEVSSQPDLQQACNEFGVAYVQAPFRRNILSTTSPKTSRLTGNSKCIHACSGAYNLQATTPAANLSKTRRCRHGVFEAGLAILLSLARLTGRSAIPSPNEAQALQYCLLGVTGPPGLLTASPGPIGRIGSLAMLPSLAGLATWSSYRLQSASPSVSEGLQSSQ